MEIIKTPDHLKSFRDDLLSQKKTLSFVPTMGALHEGHLSLVKEGMHHADKVIVSIFVNPTQFAPGEDFDSYPRTIEDDLERLEAIGTDAVWLPEVKDIYPEGEKTDVHITGVSEPLEGEFRPHFFDGVATVVKRLFLSVRPDVALFGEKDFQQLQVIRQMVQQEDMDVKIVGVAVARDKNGLALSSRNAYLSKDEYEIAIRLNHVLKEMVDGALNEDQACQLLINYGFDKVDYITKRNSDDLSVNNPSRVLAAAWIGKTRLIDNMALGT